MATLKHVRGLRSPMGVASGSTETSFTQSAMAVAGENSRPKAPTAKVAGAGLAVESFRPVEREASSKGFPGAETMATVRQGIAAKVAALDSDLQALACGGEFLASEFGGIVVALSGANTAITWGPWINRLNHAPYNSYFGKRMADASLPTPSSDPYFPTTGTSVFGNVQLHLISLRGSKRFGGSVELVLAPAEDFGIELGDRAKGLFLDLHRWLLHVHVRLTAAVFNLPPPAAQNAVLPALTTAEIEVFDSEPYTLQAGGHLVCATNITEPDVQALLEKAESEIAPRLDPLVRFALGFVHEQKLTDFRSNVSKVTAVQVSDRSIEFRTERKIPFVAVKMRTHYYGLNQLEGWFDDDAEATAEPSIWLWTSPSGRLVDHSQRQQYIGSANSTGLLTMAELSLEQISSVRYVVAYAGWTESDPIDDDMGANVGCDWDVVFDRAVLQLRSENGEWGQIGETLTALFDDCHFDRVSYAVEIEFHLGAR